VLLVLVEFACALCSTAMHACNAACIKMNSKFMIYMGPLIYNTFHRFCFARLIDIEGKDKKPDLKTENPYKCARIER